DSRNSAPIDSLCKQQAEASYDQEFNTFPELTSSDDVIKEIKLEDISKLVKDVGIDLMDLDSPVDDQPFILKVLDALPSLHNNVTETLNKFAIASALQTIGGKSVPSAGEDGTHPSEGEKNTTKVTITTYFKEELK
nr:hypothetical protein [Tanacetum cinerariifolium]